MTRDEQIELLKHDVAAWNAWRVSKKPPIELVGADPVKLDIGGAAEIADLSSANLNDANLKVANLSGAQLSSANFRGAKLNLANFSHANLAQANLSAANLSHANLSHAYLGGAILSNATLSQADLSSANLGHSILSHVDLSGANLSKANLEAANLVGADLSSAELSDANLRRADLSEANLNGAILNNADLESSTLSHANLHDTQFNKANLSDADLANALVNYATSFQGATVTGCRIERHTLESLANYGRLTPGDRMTMNIVDGVATLRSAYSGFQQWMHLTALLAFLAPYVYFVTVSLIREHFQLAPGAPQAQLRIALARFIWNGGQQLGGWHLDALSMTWFLFSLLYNVLRGFLLWKTKKLELHEQASGLPAPFSLSGWWKRLYLAATWGFWINLAVVAAHTWHFLGTWVPLPD